MSIDTNTLKETKRLAAEVAKLCAEVEADFEKVRKSTARAEQTDRPYDHLWPNTKLTAALRRRSMDLTRALADLRRR